MPRLSVLMPVRNGGRHLLPAIRSTLAALPKDAELLVLDDASTDATPEMLAGVDDARLRTVRSDDGLGIAAGLNRLLTVSDSAYVARMDADDLCLPWRFTRQLGQMQRADVSFTAALFMDDRSRVTRPDLPGCISTAAAPLHLLLASCMPHPSAMLRRDILMPDPYRAVAAEDYDLWLRLLGEGRTIMRDPIPGVRYRFHSTQTSAQSSWRARVRADQRAGTTWNSYRMAARAAGLEAAVTPEVFEFAQVMQVPAEGAPAITAFIDAVEARGRSLGAADRFTLQLRLRSLRRRVRSS